MVELDDLCGDSVLGQAVCCSQKIPGQGAKGHHGKIRALAQAAGGLAAVVLLVMVFPATGVTNRHRTGNLVNCLLQHGGQLIQAGRREDGLEEPGIKQPVVGLAVVSHQTGPVHAEDRVQVVDGDVVDEHVVASLEKGGVDGKDRD